MIDHLSTYATDFDASQAFYDAVLGALGYSRNFDMVTEWDREFPTRRACAYGPGDRPILWVIETKEPSSPRHIAFAAANRAAVDSFHAAGLSAGGRDNGKPGERPEYHRGYYGSFLLDPDSNNVEAVHHG